MNTGQNILMHITLFRSMQQMQVAEVFENQQIFIFSNVNKLPWIS